MSNPRLIDSIANLSWLALTLILAVFGLLLFNNNTTKTNTTAELALIDEVKSGEHIKNADPVLTKGKALFKNNCATCHNKNMQDQLTGPALAGVTKRWAAYPISDLYNWIRNSQKLINEGHPQALAVWNEWNPVVMNAFPNFTDEDIEAILAYVER